MVWIACVGFLFALGILCGYVNIKGVTEENWEHRLTGPALRKMSCCVVLSIRTPGLLQAWPWNVRHGEMVESLLDWGDLSVTVKGF